MSASKATVNSLIVQHGTVQIHVTFLVCKYLSATLDAIFQIIVAEKYEHVHVVVCPEWKVWRLCS